MSHLFLVEFLTSLNCAVFYFILFYFFFYSDLPELRTITVQIYKEADGKNKKDKRKLIGKR